MEPAGNTEKAVPAVSSQAEIAQAGSVFSQKISLVPKSWHDPGRLPSFGPPEKGSFHWLEFDFRGSDSDCSSLAEIIYQEGFGTLSES